MKNSRVLNLKTLITTSLLASTIISCTPKPKPEFKVGKPYSIEGVKYIPSIPKPDFKEVGLASWYGDSFHNQLTANGELFNKSTLTAAHKTLPLPSVVTVTNLENNKKIDVRVNDRGPFIRGRIIDVSEAAAKELGFLTQGSAKVMIELNREESLKALDSITISLEDRELISNQLKSQTDSATSSKNSKESPLNQPQEKTQPSSNQQESSSSQKDNKKWIKAEEIEISNKPKSIRLAEIISKKAPAKTEEQKPAQEEVKAISNDVKIQVGAFALKSKAENLLGNLGDYANTSIEEAVVNGKNFYRVKIGGFKTASEASEALPSIKEKGYKDAFVVK